MPHLSKHLPNPAPPLPVSARHCGLIPSASLPSWLHQERVSFRSSWPLNEDWCPWGMREFKNSPLCTSQRLREVCVSSELASSIHSHPGDTATATCCWAATGMLGQPGDGQEPKPSSHPAGARQGCSSTGEGKGTSWGCSGCSQAPGKRVWWGRAGDCVWDSSPHTGFLLCVLALSLSSFFSLKPLLPALRALLRKCLVLEDVCDVGSCKCFQVRSELSAILFCRDEALAFCQIQIKYLVRSVYFCLWALVSFHGALHLTQEMFARQENTLRWKVVLSSTFQVWFLCLSRLCSMSFPRNRPSSAAKESQPSKHSSKLLSVSAN